MDNSTITIVNTIESILNQQILSIGCRIVFLYLQLLSLKKYLVLNLKQSSFLGQEKYLILELAQVGSLNHILGIKIIL